MPWRPPAWTCTRVCVRSCRRAVKRSTAGLGVILELNARVTLAADEADSIVALASRAIDDAVASATPGERLVVRTSTAGTPGALRLFIGCGASSFERSFAPQGPAGARRLPESPESAAGPVGARTVLLVDDDPDIVALFTRALGRRGYDVLGAGGVEDAVRVAAERRFDVLVSDLNLADGTAIDLIARLGRPARTIALTGASGEGDAERVLGAGYSKLLIKPVTLPMIEAAIAELFTGG